MIADLSQLAHYIEGLPAVFLLSALAGAFILTFYALIHNNTVRAMFSCKLFDFSLETEKSPTKSLKK